MKRKQTTILIAVSILFSSSVIWAAGPLGAPKSDLEQNNWSIAYDVTYSKQEVEAEATVGGVTITDSIDDFQIDSYLGTFSYGLFENTDIFVRVGLADAELEDDAGVEFTDDGQLLWGIGAKVTFVEEDPVTWGGIIQYFQGEFEDSQMGSTSVKGGVEWESLQVAVGPTYDANEVTFFGGGFFHFIGGDLKLSGGGTTATADLEEESYFLGGYVGAQFNLTQQAAVSVEFQYSGDVTATSAGIRWKF